MHPSVRLSFPSHKEIVGILFFFIVSVCTVHLLLVLLVEAAIIIVVSIIEGEIDYTGLRTASIVEKLPMSDAVECR